MTEIREKPIKSLPKKQNTPLIRKKKQAGKRDPLKVEFQFDPAHPGAFHMKSGAVFFNSIHNVIVFGADYASEKLGTEEYKLGRLAKALVFDWFLASLYVGGWMHEVSGHGTDTEFGCSHTYDPTPPNWGNKRVRNCSRELTRTESILNTGRGTEATQFLSQHVATQMMERGKMRYNNSIFYVDTKMDISNYIFVRSPFFFMPDTLGEEGEKGDISSYYKKMAYKHLDDLESKHGIQEVVKKDLWKGPNFSPNALYVGAAWNLLDPTFFYSLYNIARYVWTGKKEVEMPWIMPRTHFLLSPDGPEYMLRVPFKLNALKDTVIDPYFRVTTTYDNQAVGFGANVSNFKVWKDRLTFEGSFDVWKKPDGWGGGFGLGATTAPLKKLGFLSLPSIGAGFKWKTTGHSFGDRYYEGVEAWIRTSFNID